MLAALIAGQRNPHELAALARRNIRAQASVRQEPLTGTSRSTTSSPATLTAGAGSARYPACQWTLPG
jgi:hypothetical protein